MSCWHNISHVGMSFSGTAVVLVCCEFGFFRVKMGIALFEWRLKLIHHCIEAMPICVGIIVVGRVEEDVLSHIL